MIVNNKSRGSDQLLLLVSSAGGHFLQLYMLEDALWKNYPHIWITFNKNDTSSMLKDKKVYWAYWPTNRNILNLIKNSLLACKIFYKYRPTAVISTGAGVGVPFIMLGYLFGIKTIFIESFARKKTLSLSGHLVYWFVDHFFVQSKSLAERFKHSIYLGSIY